MNLPAPEERLRGTIAVLLGPPDQVYVCLEDVKGRFTWRKIPALEEARIYGRR
jgi:hypothetical protein